MDKQICYRTDTKQVVIIKDTDWTFGAKEINGNPFIVVTLDLSQEILDDIETNRIPISDGVHTNDFLVDVHPNPTTLERAE